MAGKVIISCAITGSIHTPSMSDALPITPEEIARSAIDAAEAGAAIIHLHARDPQSGEPTPDPAVFMKFLPVIKQSTEAVVNITTGSGPQVRLPHGADPGTRLTVNGVQGNALPFPTEREGKPFSTCALAFFEDWTDVR